MEAWIVSNKDQAERFSQFVLQEEREGRTRVYEIQQQTRSVRQNSSLHSCLRRLASELNSAGFGIPHPLKPELEIPWSESSCKELLLRPIIDSLYNETSTSKLTTTQLSEAMTIMLNRVAEITGVVCGFTLEEEKLLNGYKTNRESR